jgi:two-component system KDP operon response regulator KdpE
MIPANPSERSGPRAWKEKIETDPNDPRLLVTDSGVGYRLQARLEAGAAE